MNIPPLSNEPIIRFQQLSKCYNLRQSPIAKLGKALWPKLGEHNESFWALRGVSAEIKKGEIFGIIGRNGSGKSTLLQMIAGVLKPTAGELSVTGRIAALLELGAGFNPQFSGRENVFLNGAIQGFSREEMEQRLPQILEFSELGEFIDQPIKYYSSGMYVRLAFAAAIHVDADILIVDEALAVGDAKFQTKCYRQFLQFHEQGKTILLVTHDAAAVVRYCNRALLLNNGQMVLTGPASEVVNHYFQILYSAPDSTLDRVASVAVQQSQVQSEVKTPQQVINAFLETTPTEDHCPTHSNYNPNEHRYGNKEAEIIDYLVVCDGKVDPPLLKTHDEIVVYVKVRFYVDIAVPLYSLTLKNLHGLALCGSNTLIDKTITPSQVADNYVIVHFRFNLRLINGDFHLNLGVSQVLDSQEIIPLDRRYDLIHLKVTPHTAAFGIADLDGVFRELL